MEQKIGKVKRLGVSSMEQKIGKVNWLTGATLTRKKTVFGNLTSTDREILRSRIMITHYYTLLP